MLTVANWKPRSIVAIAVVSASAAAFAQPVPPERTGAIAGAFAWRITVPSPLPLRSVNEIPITVSVGARQATGIKLKSQQLFEKVLNRPIRTLVFREAGNDPASGISVAAGVTTTLHLVPQAAGRAIVGPLSLGGEFVGSIVMAADGKLEGDEVKLDVVTTSGLAWAVGFGVLAAGVFIGSFLAPVLPSPGPDGERVSWRSLPRRIAALRGSPDGHPAVAAAEASTRELVDRLIDQDPRAMAENSKEREALVGDVIPKLRSAAFDSAHAWTRSGISLTKVQARLLVNTTSVAIGANTLILTNSFGTPKDYITCLLWGLGAPLGSKAITSLVAIATGAAAQAPT